MLHSMLDEECKIGRCALACRTLFGGQLFHHGQPWFSGLLEEGLETSQLGQSVWVSAANALHSFTLQNMWEFYSAVDTCINFELMCLCPGSLALLFKAPIFTHKTVGTYHTSELRTPDVKLRNWHSETIPNKPHSYFMSLSGVIGALAMW